MSFNTPRQALLSAVILAIAMMSVLAWQGYAFWTQEQHRSAIETSTPSPRDRAKPIANIDLASLNLFGSPTDTPTAPVSTEDLPETNLRIFLRGVMAADGEYPASALIEDSENHTEAYVVNDDLPGSARLRSVFPNRVIIERSGKLENLYFPETSDDSGVSFMPADAAVDTSEASGNSAPSPSDADAAQPAATPAPAGSDQRREEIRKRLEQLRERLKNNSN